MQRRLRSLITCLSHRDTAEAKKGSLMKMVLRDQLLVGPIGERRGRETEAERSVRLLEDDEAQGPRVFSDWEVISRWSLSNLDADSNCTSIKSYRSFRMTQLVIPGRILIPARLMCFQLYTQNQNNNNNVFDLRHCEFGLWCRGKKMFLARHNRFVRFCCCAWRRTTNAPFMWDDFSH